MVSPTQVLRMTRGAAGTGSCLTRQARSFARSSIRASSGGKLSTDDSVKTDQYAKDSKHATDKDQLDVQSNSSAKGRDAKANDEGGSATQAADVNNSTAKAKKEHPEAPDVVIGMQDERGGKGH